MKFVSHITCIFAIIAQIFLSSVVFAHDVTCQSSNSFFTAGAEEPLSTQHTPSCGCCHSSEASESVLAVDFDALGESFTPHYPPNPCTCSSDSSQAFTAEEYSVETRDRKISLVPIACVYDDLSFIILPNFPSLNTILNADNDCFDVNQRGRLIHLEKYSGRFVSTHLSKFLL